ncbi:MAG: flagellar basal body-associated FliL family protein [Chromatiales bacterium]|nr:flagellar basal body-associated FliL family protein [Chromatiales bacterium]
MATEETAGAEAAAPAAAAKSGSLLKAVGTVIGLFLLLLTTQLAAPILGCKLLNSMTPNCPAPVVVVDKAGKEVAAPKGPPLYLPMDPPLVVSLEDKGSIRFLQVTVELMSRDEHVITALQTHMPVIRNNLLMLLGGQAIGSLTSREDKEEIRRQALAEVQKILKANPPGEKEKRTGTVEDLYFTSFVVQ